MTARTHSLPHCIRPRWYFRSEGVVVGRTVVPLETPNTSRGGERAVSIRKVEATNHRTTKRAARFVPVIRGRFYHPLPFIPPSHHVCSSCIDARISISFSVGGSNRARIQYQSTIIGPTSRAQSPLQPSASQPSETPDKRGSHRYIDDPVGVIGANLALMPSSWAPPIIWYANAISTARRQMPRHNSAMPFSRDPEGTASSEWPPHGRWAARGGHCACARSSNEYHPAHLIVARMRARSQGCT